jgi:IS5 family transposase
MPVSNLALTTARRRPNRAAVVGTWNSSLVMTSSTTPELRSGATQIQQRTRGEKITDRLVSVADPDARPIRKGKLGRPNEFGYVAQIAEATANTRRGARGYVLPAATAPGNPGENRLLDQTAAELDRLGLRPREVALDGGFAPGPTEQTLARLAPARTFIAGRGEPGSRRTRSAWPATAPAAKGASATSNAATRCGAAASRATRGSGSGPAGRSWPTTSTPWPSTPADRTRPRR